MKAGESPLNQGRSVKAAPVRFLKAVSRYKENAAVERREVNARRNGRAPQGVSMLPAPFGAPLPSHFVRESSPLVREGMKCPALPAPCENRGGGALAVFVLRIFAGCLK